MRRTAYDLRTSPTHRVFLETPGFTAYLPHALRWALRAEVVLVAIPFGVILGVFAPSWLGLFFLTLFGGTLLAWLLTVQSRAIWGFGDAPRLDLAQLDLFQSSMRPLIEIGSAVIGGYGLLFLTAPGAAQWFAWTSGALLPSVFALIAAEGAVAPALDPRRIARVAVAAGPPGWLLMVLGAVVTGWTCRELATFFAALDVHGIRGLMDGWAPNATTVGWTILGIWISALLVHLQGHALHHHREFAALPVQVAAADEIERAAVSSAVSVEKVANAIDAAKTRGDRAAIEQWTRLPPPDGVTETAYLHELWELLLIRRLYAPAVLVAHRLVMAAATDKRYALAVEVLIEAWRLSPSFEPGPVARLALVRAALASNDTRILERLGKIDAARWPDDPAAVELVYLYAGWLAERKGDIEGARGLLASVLDREHVLKPRIAALHAVLGES
ncbi:MAG: hypothetical protein WD081_08500 [Gammaproteobacteria bacterium]